MMSRSGRSKRAAAGARYELGLAAIDESGDYDIKRRLASVVVGFGISPG